MLDVENRQKALDLTLAAIDKKYGKGMVFAGETDIVPIEVIPTGHFGLDLGLGVGGIPRGRITEIFGPEGLGKSMFCGMLAAEAQRMGLLVAYVDAEHALDASWFRKLGVDWPKMYISQPANGEQALQVTDHLVASGAFGLVIVDSVAALTPRAEIEGEIGDSLVAAQPRMMSQALRMINPKVGPSETALVFTNQIREKIGPMVMGGTTPSGGRALRFYASVRIELKKIENVTDKSTGEIVGMRVRANILKNRVAPPFKKVEYEVLHGIGVNNAKIVMEMAEKFKMIGKRGNFYYILDENGDFGDKSFANGINQAVSYIEENPTFYTELKSQVTSEYNRRNGNLDDDSDG